MYSSHRYQKALLGVDELADMDIKWQLPLYRDVIFHPHLEYLAFPELLILLNNKCNSSTNARGKCLKKEHSNISQCPLMGLITRLNHHLYQCYLSYSKLFCYSISKRHQLGTATPSWVSF